MQYLTGNKYGLRYLFRHVQSRLFNSTAPSSSLIAQRCDSTNKHLSITTFQQGQVSGNGSRPARIPLWAAAGIAVLANLSIAHTEEEQPTSTPQLAGAGNRHTAQWRIYTNKAQELWGKGDPGGAERYMVRALEEAKLGFGARDGHVAAAHNNLAEVYRKMRQFERAEQLYLEGLQIMEGAYGLNDQRYAMALYHIAMFYSSQRKHEAARQYFRKSLQAVEGSLGKGHPMYATLLSSYADLERVTDNKPQAVALYRQALETLDALGASHVGEMLLAACKRGDILIQFLRRFHRSTMRLYLRQAEGMDILVAVLEDEQIFAAVALDTASKLGQMMIMAGQGDEGVAALRRCVQQAEGLHPQDSPGHASALPNHMEVLATGLHRTGDLAGARDQRHAAIRLRTGRGASSRQLATTMVQCAEVEVELGVQKGEKDSYLRAHNLAQQAKEICKKGLEARARMAKRGTPEKSGWRSWLSQVQGNPSAEAPQPRSDAQYGDCYLKACGVAAKALEKLGRLDEAQDSLLHGVNCIEILQDWLEKDFRASWQSLEIKAQPSQSAATAPTLPATLASLPRDAPLPLILERELLLWQSSVDFLYNYVRLTMEDEGLPWVQTYASIVDLLRLLHARVPVQYAPPTNAKARTAPKSGSPTQDGVTSADILARLRKSRDELNRLQREMDVRKRNFGIVDLPP